MMSKWQERTHNLRLFILTLMLLSQDGHATEVSAAFPQETINIALSSVPSQLNPFFATDANSQNLGRLTHQSLIDTNSKMEFVCIFCQSYRDWVEQGKHHIRFLLRQDQLFWDGTVVTALDVEKSVFYFSTENKSLASIFRFSFQEIEKVIIHGPFDVEFIYKKFNLENFSNLPLLKIIKLTTKGLKKLSLALEPIKLEDIIGAGIYRYENLSELAVKLTPVHQDNNLIRPKLNFKVVKDESTLALKIIHGEVDLSVAELSPRKYYWLMKHYEKNLASFQTQGTNLVYVAINHRRKILSDWRVRKALSLLIPREDLLKYKLKNTVTLASSLMSPAFKNYYSESAVDGYHPPLARQLLDESGFKKDQKGFRFNLNWRISNNKMNIEMAETIKSYFAQEGIMIELIIQEWGTFYRGFKNGEYDLASASWVGLTGPEMLRSVFHSENFAPKGLNRGYYQNKLFEEKVEEATTQTDPKKGKALYQEAQRLVGKDYPYLYLWHPNIIWVGQKCLSMGEVYPNGSFYPLLTLNRQACSQLKK